MAFKKVFREPFTSSTKGSFTPWIRRRSETHSGADLWEVPGFSQNLLSSQQQLYLVLQYLKGHIKHRVQIRSHHCAEAVVILSPKKNLTAEQEAKVAKHLASYKASLSEIEDNTFRNCISLKKLELAEKHPYPISLTDSGMFTISILLLLKASHPIFLTPSLRTTFSRYLQEAAGLI